ncbi:MFS multidrug transporter [Coprinopsis cinerea okayama7|uniref:MFS multidrug transporter n=1 Tax=Coprinopsis cinerea (strain Okayama-7 / 130 / ATCC MYA-4618 / FGSC 9003) TaxID=240176 RepID=A8NKB7_COPC7|nr:MFS multidrug transporter [Coprinopsis cinerea okayama7\|eukprot:XP_001834403.2 MFS multidrug transporter [Coprinopsis cinerea okayama7\
MSVTHSENSDGRHTSHATGAAQRKGAKFWLIFASLSVTLFLSALDFTALASALPIIVHELDGSDFAWAGTAYALSSTAFLPMSGGLTQIVGRRIAFIIALAFFALGSAFCGAAKTMDWLIAARTIQGIGGGAIISLASIVISDLVTLQERGTYNGLLGMTWAVAVALGPIVGGSLAEKGAWRWLFYFNLPVCGVSFVLVMFFMALPTPKGTLKEKFFAMDWIGNILVIASSSALVIALTWGGGRYPWNTAQVLVPLILGVLGLIAWWFYEVKYSSHPTVAPELLGNRTSVSGYLQVFFNSLGVVAWVYYMPVYFQACKGSGPIRSGIEMFGGTLNIGPFVVFSGVSVTAFKVYRPQLWFGWVLTIVGVAAMSTLKADSPLSHAIGFSVLSSGGAGIIFAATYFPVLSPLPVTLNASALALFAFVRSLAQIWGITFGSVALTNELAKRLPNQIVSVTAGGIERVYAFIPAIGTLDEPLRGQVRTAFGESLRPVWYMLCGIIGLGLLSSLLMKDVPLHNYVDEKWMLDENRDEGVPATTVELKGLNAHTNDAASTA